MIPASHGELEAIFKAATGEPKGVGIVCHPHPLGGGTMHNKVVFRAAAGLVDAGLETFRFNFRGVGSSTGEHDEIDGGIDDVKDVLNYVDETYPQQDLTLAGFSFGARTGLAVGKNDDRVKRLISIGTPVDKYDFNFLNGLTKPILFLHGSRDEFGSTSKIQELANEISTTAETELIVFDDCGHFFDEHLSQLRTAIFEWTSKQLNEI